jgi:hypothetical protein
MGYLRNFEDDVFISYAHLDDDQLVSETCGWVAQLHEDLERHLRQKLPGGDRIRLWRDDEIRKYEDFTSKILRRIPNVAIILLVSSPVYFSREWCDKELEAFCRHAHNRLGIKVDEEKVRIFKVEKRAVDREQLPKDLKVNSSYKFHAAIPPGARNDYVLRPKFGGDYFVAYYQRVEDLSDDLAKMLLTMRSLEEGQPEPASTAVYLAEVTSDLRSERDVISRDLKAYGYTVLPGSELPNEVHSLKEQVRGYLNRSVLSIHVVGNEFGIVPEGEAEKSKQWIQHDLAIEREQNGAFERLLLIPKSTSPQNPRQRNFIDYLCKDETVQNGAEYVESVQQLKEVLEKTLRKTKEASQSSKAERPQKKPRKGNDPVRVYIICDSADRGSENLLALKRKLLSSGCEPLLAVEDQDERLALEEHIENMKLCDAAMIYYGKGSQKWYNTKLMDFRKYLRKQSVLAKAIYIVPPITPEKAELETLEAMILRSPDADSLPPLNDFLNRLKA